MSQHDVGNYLSPWLDQWVCVCVGSYGDTAAFTSVWYELPALLKMVGHTPFGHTIPGSKCIAFSCIAWFLLGPCEDLALVWFPALGFELDSQLEESCIAA